MVRFPTTSANLQVAATRKASLRAVATSAVREARNGNTFVRQVKVCVSLSLYSELRM